MGFYTDRYISADSNPEEYRSELCTSGANQSFSLERLKPKARYAGWQMPYGSGSAMA